MILVPCPDAEAVEEAAAAGITEMIFITERNKRSIEDHFDKTYELESKLQAKGKDKLLETVKESLPSGVNCVILGRKVSLQIL